MAAMSAGGSVVTLTASHFDAQELLETIVTRRVKGVCIVGDAFAKPILAVLDADPGRFDLGHLRLIMSSGAMLSRASKERLSSYARNARVVDGLGSSESGSLGTAVTTPGKVGETARFHLGPDVRVLDAGNKDVAPGSPEAGRIAIGGHLPLGYYKDPAKTAATFVTVDGRRYAVAGDFAKVSADGSIVLLGRGSSCINTAGEKVYPEEVEEVLKTVGAVRDAAVVGVPDERFGEAVVALVEMEGDVALDEAGLMAHTRSSLAGFKVPRRIITVERVERLPNGKMDYTAMKAAARAALGL
jgi:acyl-CoA synthetase (AMP-forming)/AMP-acid ligase II